MSSLKALSRQFMEKEEATANPDTILPSTCLVAPLTWEVEERVRTALGGHSGPSACPPVDAQPQPHLPPGRVVQKT